MRINRGFPAGLTVSPSSNILHGHKFATLWQGGGICLQIDRAISHRSLLMLNEAGQVTDCRIPVNRKRETNRPSGSAVTWRAQRPVGPQDFGRLVFGRLGGLMPEGPGRCWCFFGFDRFALSRGWLSSSEGGVGRGFRGFSSGDQSPRCGLGFFFFFFVVSVDAAGAAFCPE